MKLKALKACLDQFDDEAEAHVVGGKVYLAVGDKILGIIDLCRGTLAVEGKDETYILAERISLS